MRRHHGTAALLFLTAMLGSMAPAGMAKAKPQAARTVYLRDVDGALLKKTRYVWFTQRRVLVPISAYETLGFRVRRSLKDKTVKIITPHTGQTFSFAVGQQTVREPDNPTGALVRYERPLMQIRRGEFYIAAMALKEYFPTLIETRWDPHNRAVTIRRLAGLKRLLQFGG